MPLGTLSVVGSIFGVSRQRVEQIARKNGFVGYKSQTPEQRVIPGKTGRRLCPDCGKPIGKQRFTENRVAKQRCEDCRWIWVDCAECGTPKRWHTNEYLQKANGEGGNRGIVHTSSTPMVFCNRVCMGRYRGRTVGFAASPEHATAHSAVKKAANRDAVLRAIDAGATTTQEVITATGLSKSPAWHHLHDLVADGILAVQPSAGAHPARYSRPLEVSRGA